MQVEYLTNIIERDQRFIKKLTRPITGFKSVRSASATLAAIEVAYSIRKVRFEMTGKSAFLQLAEPAA